MPETYFIRKAVVQLDTAEQEYIWQDDAACAFQPPELFEIASFDSPISQGIDPEGDDPVAAIRDLNSQNFKRAQEICNTCPVWHLCYTEAALDDFDWTVRAGIKPALFNEGQRGRPRADCGECSGPRNSWDKTRKSWYCKPCRNATRAAWRAKLADEAAKVSLVKAYCCSRGHYNWTPRKSGGRRCQTCAAARQREYKAAARKDKPASRRTEAVSIGQTCVHGHDEWSIRIEVRKDGTESKRHTCRPCKRRSEKEARERKQSATMAA